MKTKMRLIDTSLSAEHYSLFRILPTREKVWRKVALLSVIFLPLFAFGQGGFVPPQQALKVVNGVTSPIPNATITVCAANASGIPCAPALVGTIFKDNGLTQPLSNPFTSDATGNYQFAALSGQYTVTVTAAGFAGNSYQAPIAIVGSGSNTFTGNNTFTTGVTVACNLESGFYIGGSCASTWGNGDIGSQANTAYAACPAALSFCKIQVLGQGTVYAFTTPITFSTAGKIVLFDLGGNTLNYTPTTATTAITLTYGALSSNGGFQPHGVINGILQNNGCPAGNGCGGYISATSATGIIVGSSTNGAIGPQISNMVISGFSNGIYFPVVNNEMWGASLINDMISSNTNGLLCDIGGAYESMQLFGVKFTINLTGLSQKCNFEIYMHGGSFDGNNTSVAMVGAHLFIDGVRFEATNSVSGLFITSTGGAVSCSNCYFQDDNATGTIASWFTCSNAQFDFSHIDVSSAGRTTTAGVINVGSGCNLLAAGGITNDTPAVLTNLIAGAATNQLYTVNSGGVNSFNAISLNAFSGYSLTGPNGTGLLCSSATPTFTSGFNTNGTIGANANGSCSFFVSVGSGAATSTGVIGLPTARSGWNCFATNQSRADLIQQTNNSTTSATFTNFGTTFAATNFTNGDAILISCFAR